MNNTKFSFGKSSKRIGWDYNHEIFVNMPKFYASCYPDEKPYELFEEIKKEIEGRLKLKNPFPWPYFEKFMKKYNMGMATDSFFPTLISY